MDIIDDLSVTGELSGTVQATCITLSAYGFMTGGTINGGAPATPLLITGSVLADGEADTYAIYGSGINVKVDAGGTVARYAGEPSARIRARHIPVFAALAESSTRWRAWASRA